MYMCVCPYGNMHVSLCICACVLMLICMCPYVYFCEDNLRVLLRKTLGGSELLWVSTMSG
jgi:hypothetical protein